MKNIYKVGLTGPNVHIWALWRTKREPEDCGHSRQHARTTAMGDEATPLQNMTFGNGRKADLSKADSYGLGYCKSDFAKLLIMFLGWCRWQCGATVDQLANEIQVKLYCFKNTDNIDCWPCYRFTHRSEWVFCTDFSSKCIGEGAHQTLFISGHHR